MLSLIFLLAFLFLMIAPGWLIFQKAGKPGWAFLVPIYNIIVYLDIIKKPIIWLLYLIIPVVNIYFGIMLYIELAKAFGKGTGFALGLMFLPIIFYPILGFGSAQYQFNDNDDTSAAA